MFSVVSGRGRPICRLDPGQDPSVASDWLVVTANLRGRVVSSFLNARLDPVYFVLLYYYQNGVLAVFICLIVYPFGLTILMVGSIREI